MKILITYDSYFGNTEQIAKAIGSGIDPQEQVMLKRMGEVRPGDLSTADVLIVGSPTRGFRPSEATSALLAGLPKDALHGVQVAAFDTRFAMKDMRSRMLKRFVKTFGFAAEPIAEQLEGKGGALILPAEGFIVKDTEGPLQEGELVRAAEWGKQVMAACYTEQPIQI